MRYCTKCKRDRSLSKFSENGTWCRECRAFNERERRKNRTPLSCFREHKHSAGQRGVAFLFTFEEWVLWWEQNLGADWFSLRGRNFGQYVMARNGDRGPYSIKNVRCKSCSANISEAKRVVARGVGHWRAKLSPKDVILIFTSLESKRRVAERFDVSLGTVYEIQSRKAWRHVTDAL